MIELLFGAEDLLRCRFAISPLWETIGGVSALLDPSRRAVHLPWIRRAASTLDTLDIAPLAALLRPEGYVPDFISPPPEGPLAAIEDQLAAMRATPAAQVALELGWAFEGRAVPDAARELLDHPESAAGVLADLAWTCWEKLVGPVWPQLRDLLEGDVLHRSRQLATGGMERLLDDLNPQVRWAVDRVVVDAASTESRDLAGLGLVFIPSVFAWPRPRVMLDPPWQPTLIYPARGIGGLWDDTPTGGSASLGALLGPTRAKILRDLCEPVSTTRLAARHQMSLGAVSAQLGILWDAGLVSAHRVGRQVLYEQTPLGSALVHGSVTAVPPR